MQRYGVARLIAAQQASPTGRCSAIVRDRFGRSLLSAKQIAETIVSSGHEQAAILDLLCFLDDRLEQRDRAVEIIGPLRGIRLTQRLAPGVVAGGSLFGRVGRDRQRDSDQERSEKRNPEMTHTVQYGRSALAALLAVYSAERRSLIRSSRLEKARTVDSGRETSIV